MPLAARAGTRLALPSRPAASRPPSLRFFCHPLQSSHKKASSAGQAFIRAVGSARPTRPGTPASSQAEAASLSSRAQGDLPAPLHFRPFAAPEPSAAHGTPHGSRQSSRSCRDLAVVFPGGAAGMVLRQSPARSKSRAPCPVGPGALLPSPDQPAPGSVEPEGSRPSDPPPPGGLGCRPVTSQGDDSCLQT